MKITQEHLDEAYERTMRAFNAFIVDQAHHPNHIRADFHHAFRREFIKEITKLRRILEKEKT